MSRKLYAAFVPLVAVVAMAMTAGAAQAEPHWYECKHVGGAASSFQDSSCSVAKAASEYETIRLPFEPPLVKTHVKTFGVLTLHNATLGEVKCFVDDHGKVWNTVLAAPGKDEVQVFENYECESIGAVCKAGLEVTSEGLPWPTELVVVAGVIRVKIGSAATKIKVRVKCANPVVNVVFEGELTPKWVNAKQASAPPIGGLSYAEFDTPGSGVLASAVGNGNVTGNDFVVGVVNGENILVKNP